MTPVLTFFNNKGGVGKTSLAYHLAWMYAELGKCVVVADFDPQANLTAFFLSEDEIESIWDKSGNGKTIYSCVKPLMDIGDITPPILKKISPDIDLYLLPGDVALSSFEDTLSEAWPSSMNDRNLYRPMRILSAFWQVLKMAAENVQADIILLDIGPNLGAINRSALIATNYVVVPLAADLFSLQGLENLGPALRGWPNLWEKRLRNWSESGEASERPDFKLPAGDMKAIGYILQQVGMRLERPVAAYDKWANKIPALYREMLSREADDTVLMPAQDPCCLSIIKHYRSLIPIAQELNKPVFMLTPKDGAFGNHMASVADAKKDFHKLAEKISESISCPASSSA
jgi:cellulose biosynthesis protein BcsQ